MSLMVWNAHFATGIAILDEQHQWLVDRINVSAPILAIERHEARAEALLDELESYAASHFATEDELMRAHRVDPRHLRHHLGSHARFASEVRRMRAAYRRGDAPSGSELLAFLANWLIYHILGEDQAMARQILAIEAGDSPAEAFETAAGSRRDPTHAALTQALIDLYTLKTEQNRKLIESNLRLAENRTQLEELVSARTSDLLRALDAAEAANRARNSFIANMSHEIRTPMNTIVGLTWSLRKNTGDPAQLARLAQVDEAARRLMAIINDLLDMARIESDRLQLEPLDFDPTQVLHEVLASVASEAAAKGLTLRLAPPELPALLHGDPLRLGQILSNFASNAVKFTTHGGIDIRVQTLPGGSVPSRLRLRIAVADSGPGIAPDLLPRLFEPFGQLDASTTRRHGGTGLGLAISRRLAEMMGGKVGVDSTPGEGSTFWLEVPLQRVAPAPSGSGPEAGEAALATAGTGAAGGAPAHGRQTLRRLAALLAEDDVAAVALWHGAATDLRPLLGGQAGALEAALAAYDFFTAHALLASLPGGGGVSGS